MDSIMIIHKILSYKMSPIGLVFLLGWLITAETALTNYEKATIIEIYEKQVSLNDEILNYWRSMVKLYNARLENPPTDGLITGYHHAPGTITEFLSLFNIKNLTMELNIVTWACYIFYKEAVDPPEIEKAEKCQRFARFLSWYSKIFSVDTTFEKCNRPGSTSSDDYMNYMYRVEKLVVQMEKCMYHLDQMNEKLLNADDDENIFEKLREKTKYYLSKKDVVPIRELLSKRNYEGVQANSDNANHFTVEFSTFTSLFRKPRGQNYEEDYHDEIFRRLWLFLGRRPLLINHFIRAYLETTTEKSIAYIENLTPPLSLSKKYWERIMAIQDMPTKSNFNVVEKAILMHKEFLDIFLTYMGIEVPKNLETSSCDSVDQNNYVQYILKLNKK